MRKIVLTLFALIFVSCNIFFIPAPNIGTGVASSYSVWLDNRDGYVVSNYNSHVLTKDGLLEYVYNENPTRDYRTSLRVVYESSDDEHYYPDDDSVLTYLQLYYNKEQVIYAKYPQGIPIILYRYDGYSSYRNRNERFAKPIIMTNGYVELADSCYNNNIILPIAPNSVKTEFNKKNCSIKLKYKDKNGNLKDFKEFFER